MTTTNIVSTEQRFYTSSPFQYLDTRKFEQLASGHRQIMRDTANAFIAFMPSMLAELEGSVQRQEANTAGKLLHKIKASTSLMSKDNMYENILNLERSVIRVASPEFKHDVAELIASIRMLIEESRQFITRL
ncbi:MAG: hypothetical protein HC859_16365 [Bacteroidia bacterium]|nr:hypothetical protein [Bacteroidia bacterium]